MSFLEMVKNRYSERFFDSRPVEQEKLDQILEAGRFAPTAVNKQPQRIFVFQTEEAQEMVRKIHISTFNAPLIILVCYDITEAAHNPYDSWYEDYNTGEQDAAIVAATMMYEAEELGVHSVWMRGFTSQDVAEKLNLPEHIVPVMMFAMGYPSKRSRPHPFHYQRKPVHETVTIL